MKNPPIIFKPLGMKTPNKIEEGAMQNSKPINGFILPLKSK
jgi:hypothetical protein